MSLTLHDDHEDNGPTEAQIEEDQIDRQIEYSEEAFRGEHGEDEQRKEATRRRDAETRARAAVQLALEKDRLTDALGSPALVKACLDYFDYALQLRSGEVIRFQGAKWHGNGWLTLSGIDAVNEHRPPHRHGLPFPADRGVDIRLEEILWVMDAPCGS